MKKPSKTTLIRSGITVAVLVVAIVAGSLFAQSRRPPAPATIQLTAAQQSKSDYENALSALSNEATPTAIALLEHAVATDPSNTAAKAKLAELKKSVAAKTPTAPAPSATPTKAPEPSGPDPFLGAIDLKKLLPAAMDGYSLGSAQIIAPDATIAGEPDAAGSDFTNIVWAVHDRGSESAAQKFVDGLSNGTYSKNKAPVNVKGVTATFGTDGTRFASVVFRRGRYAYEVIVTSSSTPLDAKALAEKAAAAFPAAP